jgi:hypothetical protein
MFWELFLGDVNNFWKQKGTSNKFKMYLAKRNHKLRNKNYNHPIIFTFFKCIWQNVIINLETKIITIPLFSHF